MSYDAKIAANVESASIHGWTPIDFGAVHFDEELVRAVAIFQNERILPTTGVVDGRTWRAFKAWREGVEERNLYAKRFSAVRELYSRSKFESWDPRTIRSAVFQRVFVAASNPEASDFLLRPMRAGLVGATIVPVTHPLWHQPARVARQTARPTFAAVGGVSDAKRAVGDDLLSKTLRAFVVTVGYTGADVVDFSTVSGALEVILAIRREVSGSIPCALAIRPIPPRRLSKRTRRALSELLRTCDAFMPVIDPLTAPEAGFGMVTSDHDALAGAGLDARTFPLIDVRGSENYVHRCRLILRELGIRGYGLTAIPRDTGRGRFFGPLPARVRKIDGGGHGIENLRGDSGRVAWSGDRLRDTHWPRPARPCY